MCRFAPFYSCVISGDKSPRGIVTPRSPACDGISIETAGIKRALAASSSAVAEIDIPFDRARCVPGARTTRFRILSIWHRINRRAM